MHLYKVCVVALFILFFQNSVAFRGKTFFSPRSQGANIARDYAGINRFLRNIHQNDETFIATMALVYQRSFAGEEDITQHLFGAKKLFVSGSRVSGRNECDILADYFGLPTDFKSIVRFDPLVQNVIIPWHANVSLHSLCEGLFVIVSLPLAHTRWGLNIRERVSEKGQDPYPAGYMGSKQIDREDLPENFIEAMQGNTIFGDLTRPMMFGTIPCKNQTETRLADIALNLEYSFFDNRRYDIILGMRTVVPTGNRSQAKVLFEPIVGNGGHWELGVTAHGRYDVWNDEAEERNVRVYFDASVTHMFSSKQWRSFDLCKNGLGSRYMLLQEMGNPVVDQVTLGTITGPLIQEQYHAQLFHAVDVTTFHVDVGVGAHVDAAVKLVYQHHKWNFDIGYNIWGRSKENIHGCVKLPCGGVFGVKGDSQLYGYLVAQQDTLFVGLNATQSCATLHAGQGDGNTTGMGNFGNKNVDNSVLAFFDQLVLLQSVPGNVGGVGTQEQVNGSNQAKILSVSDINFDSGCAPGAIVHKLFGSVGYTHEQDERSLFFAIGLEGSFAGRTIKKRGVLSEWSVWAKSGIAF